SFIVSNMALITNSKVFSRASDEKIGKRILKDIFRALEGNEGSITIQNFSVFMKILALTDQCNIDAETIYRILDKEEKGVVEAKDFGMFLSALEEFIAISNDQSVNASLIKEGCDEVVEKIF